MDTTKVEYPLYQSHKKVRAVKIARCTEDFGSGEIVMIPEDTQFAPIVRPADFRLTRKPTGEGFFVVYADGYESWSPKQAFEEGYVRIEE